MQAPVLVTPPAEGPVTLQAAKDHLRVSHAEDDAQIQMMIDAATGHLDGWTGILGRALVSQQWRQGYGGWHQRLRLPLGPVISVDNVTYTDTAGTEQTVPVDQYAITYPSGLPEIVLRAAFTWPGVSGDVVSPVQVIYTAGYASPALVPTAIRQAILLHVGTLYEYRETLAEKVQPTLAYEALIAPYRRH
jgi:uncharacterized phiE125 gp8 family phage protein